MASTCLDRINDLSSRGFTEEHIRMITSSMYIGEDFELLMENEPDTRTSSQLRLTRLVLQSNRGAI